eukprot:scaffold44252_cov22-Tisochrysis_lutea.AAC.1
MTVRTKLFCTSKHPAHNNQTQHYSSDQATSDLESKACNTFTRTTNRVAIEGSRPCTWWFPFKWKQNLRAAELGVIGMNTRPEAWYADTSMPCSRPVLIGMDTPAEACDKPLMRDQHRTSITNQKHASLAMVSIEYDL